MFSRCPKNSIPSGIHFSTLLPIGCRNFSKFQSHHGEGKLEKRSLREVLGDDKLFFTTDCEDRHWPLEVVEKTTLRK